jgi:hypothetical protein
VLGILIAIVAHRRAARAVAECTALINGSHRLTRDGGPPCVPGPRGGAL